MITSEKKNKHLQLEDRKEVKLHAAEYTSAFTKTNATYSKLLKAPFVCNGCCKQNHTNCIFPRRKYTAKTAQKEYETTLVESREGIPLNKEKFYETERILSAAVKSGQHIYHAITANELPVSKSTVYRHIQAGYYEISKIDLPRAVKFKQRKSKKAEYVPSAIDPKDVVQSPKLFV